MAMSYTLAQFWAITIKPLLNQSLFQTKIEATPTNASTSDSRGDFASYLAKPPHWKTCPAIYRCRLALATEIAVVIENYGHLVTAQTHDEPYSMWRRVSMCLPWRITPAVMLRVDDTDHSQPIVMLTIPA